MRIHTEPELDFDDVLLLPQRTKAASRKDVVLEREFKFYHSPRVWKGVPIMVANFDTTGVFGIAEKLMGLNVITVLHKFYSAEQIINFYQNYLLCRDDKIIDYVWLSIGWRNEELEKLDKIRETIGITPNIVIDIANGYTDQYVEYLTSVRKKFPEAIICAGNVCSEEMVGEYILHGGVDIVKVGIGPGSVCTTRKIAGVGRPQLSAIDVCSHKAHGLYSQERHLGLICGDGGCKTPADVGKGFCANADFMMLGGMIAGASECEGEWEYGLGYERKNIELPLYLASQLQKLANHPDIYVKIDNPEVIMEPKINISYLEKSLKAKKSLKFYGMSSREAMEKNSGGMSAYKASEGKCVSIPHKGPVEDIIKEIMGGLRSCCSYIGAKSIKEMSRCSEFIKVNRTHNTVYGV